MNKNKSYVLWIELFIGVGIAVFGLISKIDYYSAMIFAGGVGCCSSALHQLLRIGYYTRPANREKYERMVQEAHIERIDERKQYLRAKAGLATCQITLIVSMVMAFILAVIRVEPWIIAMIFLYAIAQWLIYGVIYRRLQSRL